MDSRFTEEKLYEFLLGETSEEESKLIERSYLEDSAVFDQLLEAEEELIFDAARGDLSPVRQERCEKHFLNSPQRRERLAFASELVGALARGKLDRERREESEKNAAGDRWWLSLLSPLRSRLGLRFAGAALLVMALIAAGLLFDRQRTRRELSRAQAERARLESGSDALRSQLAQEQSRSDELSRQLGEAHIQQRALSEQISRLSRRESSIFAVALPLASLRFRGAPATRLVIPKSALLVRLVFSLGGKKRFDIYRVTLTLDGDETNALFSAHLPASALGPGGKTIRAEIPASVLHKNVYRVTLFGLTAQRAEELSRYSLPVSGR